MTEIGSHNEGLDIVRAIGERNKIINNVRDAINEYYEALNSRKNGDIAIIIAFQKIEKILDMQWEPKR